MRGCLGWFRSRPRDLTLSHTHTCIARHMFACHHHQTQVSFFRSLIGWAQERAGKRPNTRLLRCKRTLLRAPPMDVRTDRSPPTRNWTHPNASQAKSPSLLPSIKRSFFLPSAIHDVLSLDPSSSKDLLQHERAGHAGQSVQRPSSDSPAAALTLFHLHGGGDGGSVHFQYCDFVEGKKGGGDASWLKDQQQRRQRTRRPFGLFLSLTHT